MAYTGEHVNTTQYYQYHCHKGIKYLLNMFLKLIVSIQFFLSKIHFSFCFLRTLCFLFINLTALSIY